MRGSWVLPAIDATEEISKLVTDEEGDYWMTTSSDPEEYDAIFENAPATRRLRRKTSEAEVANASNSLGD